MDTIDIEKHRGIVAKLRRDISECENMMRRNYKQTMEAINLLGEALSLLKKVRDDTEDFRMCDLYKKEVDRFIKKCSKARCD